MIRFIPCAPVISGQITEAIFVPGIGAAFRRAKCLPIGGNGCQPGLIRH
jgi:hypothetical protein